MIETIKISELPPGTLDGGDNIPFTDMDGTTKRGNTSGKLDKESNLSDLLDVAIARTNLGLGSVLTGWTGYIPSISGSGGGVVGAGSIAQGYYKIIGKTCHFRATVQVPDKGTLSGNIQLGLPVNYINTLGESPISGFCCIAGENPKTQSRGYPVLNATFISFLSGVNTASYTWAVNGLIMRFYGTYETP